MSKMSRVLVLAVIGVAAFALPRVAIGAPVNDPGGVSFSGTFGLSTFTTEGESILTCEGPNHVTGTINAAGTGGTVTFDYTNCHVVILGITISCHTSGAPANNTIAMSNLGYDNVYVNASNSPGILITNIHSELLCGSVTPFVLSGNVMGTLTSPACGGTSTTATFEFIAAVAVQQHMQVGGAGTKFDLSTETKGSGTPKTTGLDLPFTITYNQSVTQTCV